MTNEQIAKSLVSTCRGGYRPADVVALIIRGIEIAKSTAEQIRLQGLQQDIAERERMEDNPYGGRCDGD